MRDSTGGVLVNAGVVLTREDGSDPRTAISDGAGRFEFRGLPRRAYRIAASAAGFAESVRTIEIDDQGRATVELVLHPAVVEHVAVTQDVLTSTLGLNATTITGAGLAALPDDPGGLLQRVRELAGATGSFGQVEITVDGFHELLWMPPKQSIQAIRISSNWFAPEFAEPGRARVDIITKPGAGRVHGDISLNFSDEALNARNALAPRPPSGHMRELTGYLSGPIIPSRWAFVVYRGRWTEQLDKVINATVLDPHLVPTSWTGTVSSPSRVDNLWVGTNVQLAPLHTLAVSFSRTTAKAANLGLDSGLDLPERSYGRTTSTQALRATLTSVPSVRLFNELRVQANPQRTGIQADSPASAVVVFDAFSGGGNQEALLSRTRHFETMLTDVLTVAVPRHTLKFGVDARSADRHYTDSTNAGGIFVFGSDFERDAAGVPVADSGGERVAISPLERYRRTLLGLSGYTPSQFSMMRGEPDVRFRETAVGAFAQDDWTARPRLSLSYGVRTDWQTAAAALGVGLRAGLAVALDEARKNIVRVGAGTFYQRIEPELTLDVMRLDGRRQELVQIDQPPFFPTIPDLEHVPASSTKTYVKDSELRAPQILMSAATYERELTPAVFVTAKYSFQRGSDLLRTRNVNATDDTGVRPHPRVGEMLQYESTGRLRRHELSSGLRWNKASGALFVNYSYVRARSDTDGYATVPADGLRLDQEFGRTAADREHSATVGGHITLPGALLVSPYVSALSGRVFNLTTGFDNNGDGLFADRPAIVAAGTAGAIPTSYGWLLADRPADALMVSRNAGREPFAVRLDLRVARVIKYSTGGTLALAASVENVLNRANFEGFNGVVTSSSFGTAKRAGTPRRLNFAVGFSF